MSILSYSGTTIGREHKAGGLAGRVKSFRPEVRKSIGVALYDAQKGDKAPTAKPFRGVDSGFFK